MTLLGTALRPAATRVMLLGSGELGKEVAIECQRLGVEVIAVDRYADAPAMHVAHRSHVINMLDGDALRRVVELEKPHYIVPEIEAIATDMLIQLEEEGLNVVPCARATKLTMNREGIRRPAAEELQLPTSTYRFADSESLFREAVAAIGYPCIVKIGDELFRQGADVYSLCRATCSGMGIRSARRSCRSGPRNC